MNEQLPPLPYAVAHILLGDDSENVFTSEQMEDYARAALAAKVPADPCLVLWKAMNQAGKVGNRTDDKLIVKFLREAGYCIAATPAPAPDAERQALRYAQAEAVMPLIGPLLDAWESADRDVLAVEPELAKRLSQINKAMEGAEAPPAPEATQFRGARRRDAAEATLQRLGYQWCGGVLWKPPLGAAPAQAQQAAEPLPCPFCGHVGLDFADGSTHRWGLASCAGCGATCGETRRTYPPDDKWHANAVKDWNTRAKPEAQQPHPDTKDAERYRWLRNESWAGYNQHKGMPQVFVEDGGYRRTMLAEEAVDDAVDKAMAGKGWRIGASGEASNG